MTDVKDLCFTDFYNKLNNLFFTVHFPTCLTLEFSFMTYFSLRKELGLIFDCISSPHFIKF